MLTVVDKSDGLAQTRDFLEAHPGQAGIIYCSTREQVDRLTGDLAFHGYPVLPYHAGMEDGIRRAHQHRFRYEDGLIMVATIAFGMGINKSNIRFILHYNMPKNIESYYQQIGRSGRDGLPADCLLLYSYSDVGTIRYFIEQESAEQRSGAEMRLSALLRFLESQVCRRIPLLDYFGEKYSKTDCQACDNCLSDGSQDSAAPEDDATRADLSDPARLLITCALQTDEIFGVAHLIKVLRGSRAKKVLQFKHDQLDSHGAGRAYSKEYWQHLATQLIRLGLLKRVPPHGSLKVTPKGKAVLQGQEVWGMLPGRFVRAVRREMPEHAPELFEQLRVLRARLAQERHVPPYLIFQDRSLIEMAAYYPRTPEELSQVYGVGKRKLEEYGPHFLPVIETYCQEHKIERTPHRGNYGISQRATPSGQQRTDYVWGQFQAGESVAAIAADLGFTQNTILNHLKKAFDAGHQLDIDRLRVASELSPEQEARVLAAFDDCGMAYLKPVFDALGGSIPYEELHLWRLIYQVRSDDDPVD